MEQTAPYLRDSIESPPSFQQRVGETNYPASAYQTQAPAIQESALDDQSRLLRDRVVTSLWSRVSFDEVANQPDLDHDRLLGAATSAMSALQQAAEEVAKLIDVIWSVNSEYVADSPVEKDVQQEVFTKLKERMLNRIGVDLRPNATPWDGEMDDEPIPIAKVAVRKRLRRQYRRFAERLIRLLDELVGAEVLGLVRWDTDRSCDVFFYREIALRRGEEVTTIRSLKGSQVVHSNVFSEIRRNTFEVRQYVKHEYEVRRALCFMKLRKAAATQADHSATVVPKKFQPILDALPAWLRPQTQTVDGERYLFQVVSERQEDVDVTTENRWEEQIFTSVDVVADPAIIIERYVLTGWGPEEEEAELTRRRAEQAEHEALADMHQAALMYWPAVSVSVVLTMVGIGVALASRFWFLLWPVGTFFTLAGGFSSAWPIHLGCQKRGRPTGALYLAASVCFVVLSNLASQLTLAGIWFASWRPLCAGIYAAALAAGVGWLVPRLRK